jgi:uncharacterized protein (TIGR00730 family)
MKSIAVYCGSSSGSESIFAEIATEIGSLLAVNNIKVIYGGGDSGLMGVVSNAAIANKGEVEGIITNHLVEKEKKNLNISSIQVVETMHERKIAMFNKADGFLVLPGGVGTLEEFFEVLSWKQLQIHRKPIILFNLNNYWSQLIELIDKTIDCKFTGENIKDAYIVVDNTAELRKVLNINVKN